MKKNWQQIIQIESGDLWRNKVSRHYSVSVLLNHHQDWGVLLVMLSVDGCIKSVKIYKNLEKLYNKKSWLFMTRKIGRLINESAFVSLKYVPNFYIFLHFLYIHRHVTSLIIPLSPDDGSAEQKRYSVDWLCFSINPHFLFGLFVVTHTHTHTHIYIYIYIYIAVHLFADSLVVSTTINDYIVLFDTQMEPYHSESEWTGIMAMKGY